MNSFVKNLGVSQSMIDAVSEIISEGDGKSPFDPDYKSQIPDKPGSKAGFDSKKTSTGTVFTRKWKKDKEKVDEASGTVLGQNAEPDQSKSPDVDDKPFDYDKWKNSGQKARTQKNLLSLTGKHSKSKNIRGYVKEAIGGAGSADINQPLDGLDDYLDTNWSNFNPVGQFDQVDKADPGTVSEETMQELTEVLSKDAKAGDWIHDFVHSKNKKFSGKSKEERMKMALGAYYAKQKESLDPKMVAAAGASTTNVLSTEESKRETPEERKRKDAIWKAARDRVKSGENTSSGDERAGKARAGEYEWGKKNEEVETLDELSKGTISSYKNKAHKSFLGFVNKAGTAKSDSESGEAQKKSAKRFKGLMAASRRTNEDKDPNMDAGCGAEQPFVNNENPTSAPSKKKLAKEEINVGDNVHVGLTKKGGSGYRGKVTKIDGKTVHFQSHEEDKFGRRTYKGNIDNATKED